MKNMDIKEKPQTELQSFSHWMNHMTSKFATTPMFGGKRIPVSYQIDVQYIPSEETLEKSYTYFGGNYDRRIAPKKRVFLYTVTKGTNEAEEDQGWTLEGDPR